MSELTNAHSSPSYARKRCNELHVRSIESGSEIARYNMTVWTDFLQ